MEYDFPSQLKVSSSCRDLLSKILVDKPEKRITISEIQKHPWYTEDLPPGVAEMNDNLPSPGPEVQASLYFMFTLFLCLMLPSLPADEDACFLVAS